jgi:valyl-tRNA synthetase
VSDPALPPQYDPHTVEAPIYARWAERGYFTADVESGKPPFCLVIPPPNVTGSLHIGHAFEHTIMDALTRWRRMSGDDTLWLPGMDHAGIATQNVVERELALEGRSRHDLGRDAFVARVWQWKAEFGGRILEQMRRLGDGVDWTRERFTMDEGLSRAVRVMFVKLFDAGLIYRAERIINWCPRCQTALSDIEVEHQDDEGELVTISYGPLTVATTRVETMLGDTAVAVHPDDDRYAHLVGTEIELPLTGRKIPVVADDQVDATFGTGAVKVTPAHDPNDFAIAQRHNLPAIEIMDERGVITLPGPFQGLDRFEARPAVSAALRERGAIVAERRPYVHAVGHCSRCDTVVEPRLSLQWFVAVSSLARAAGDAVRDGRTTIYPAEMNRRYFDWVQNMHDWCISRQLWWGHRIPVWYCPDGHMTAASTDPTACGTCGSAELEQDEDVLDTWFSSGLWPFSTLGWPDDTPDLRRYYPTTVLVTGYDIIFFWVVRMMMFGLYATGQVPFHTVDLHGMVRDGRGRKMSKSAGNAVDPLDWLDRYGADAVRFTFARGANPGSDVPVSEEWVQGSRNFVNKVWNATRLAVQRQARFDGPLPDRDALGVADRWILSRLARTVETVDEAFGRFEFGRAADVLFHFAWDEAFDWYLELAKVTLDQGGPAADASRRVLGYVLDRLLRLLHPLVPFVTEEAWTRATGGETLVTAGWPAANPEHLDAGAEREFDRLRELVTEVRRFRADQGLGAGRRVPARLVGADDLLIRHAEHIARLAALEPLTAAGSVPTGWPALSAAGARVALDLSGAIDVAAERSRLTRDLHAAEQELAQVRIKLANPQFVDRAPAEVVGSVRRREQDAATTVERITAQLAALPSA